jgi:methylglutamate dehydrogenase subunit B
MRIDCPHCGERPVDEFLCLGAAGHTRPESSNDINDWVAYVYLRKNPAGAHDELFHHVAGCRQWLIVSRDTRTHAVTRVTAARGSAA